MKHTLMHVQDKSLVDQTVSRLMDLIIDADVKRLPNQSDLADLFDVSRPVLREAVSKLEMLNIVTLKPKVGTTVNEPSQWGLVNGSVIKWRVRTGERIEHVRAAAVRAAYDTAVN